MRGKWIRVLLYVSHGGTILSHHGKDFMGRLGFRDHIYGFMRVKESPEVTFITVLRGLC
jgi:hypothetical protein